MGIANRVTFSLEDGVKRELMEMASDRYLSLSAMLVVWVMERKALEQK